MKQQRITLFSLLFLVAPQAFAEAAAASTAANIGSGGAMTQGIMLAAFAVIFLLLVYPTPK